MTTVICLSLRCSFREILVWYSDLVFLRFWEVCWLFIPLERKLVCHLHYQHIYLWNWTDVWSNETAVINCDSCVVQGHSVSLTYMVLIGLWRRCRSLSRSTVKCSLHARCFWIMQKTLLASFTQNDHSRQCLINWLSTVYILSNSTC